MMTLDLKTTYCRFTCRLKSTTFNAFVRQWTCKSHGPKARPIVALWRFHLPVIQEGMARLSNACLSAILAPAV